MPRVAARRPVSVSTARELEALPPGGSPRETCDKLSFYPFSGGVRVMPCQSKDCVLCHMAARPARVWLVRWWHRRVTTVGLAGGWIIAVEVEANELAKFVGLLQLIDYPVVHAHTCVRARFGVVWFTSTLCLPKLR